MASRLLFFFLVIFIPLQATAILKDATVSNNRLVLHFSKPLKNRSVTVSKGADSIKYIFEFKNSKPQSFLLGKSFEYQYPVVGINIFEGAKNSTEVVIESKVSYRPKNYWLSNSFIITLPPKQSTPFKNIGGVIKNLFSSIRGSSSSSSDSNSIFKTSSGKKRYKVTIDAGHGGKDVGALDPTKRYREKDAVLAIALKLRKHLQSMGFKVAMTRARDRFIKLGKRASIANSNGSDIFVSIHANSIRGSRRTLERTRGIETYYLSPARSKKAKMVAEKENSVDFEKKYKEGMDVFLKSLTHSKIVLSHKLAIDVQRSVVSALRKKYRGIENNGAKPAPFRVLVGAEMPAILIETGFISNSLEKKRLFNSYYQDRLAKGIAKGIARFLRNREREME